MNAAILPHDGLMYVGRFEGVASREWEGQTFHDCKLGQTNYKGETFTRTIGFRDTDRDSGEQTAISRDLAGIEVGSTVALRLELRATKAGKVMMSATRAVVLDGFEG